MGSLQHDFTQADDLTVLWQDTSPSVELVKCGP